MSIAGHCCGPATGGSYRAHQGGKSELVQPEVSFNQGVIIYVIATVVFEPRSFYEVR
jgi:hypothetical protein